MRAQGANKINSVLHQIQKQSRNTAVSEQDLSFSQFSLFGFLASFVCFYAGCSLKRKRELGGWVVAAAWHSFSMLFMRITLTDSL